MKWLKERKRKKFAREICELIKTEDDRISETARAEMTALLENLQTDPDPAKAVIQAEKAMAKVSLPGNRGTLRNLLDLLLVVGAVAFGLRGLYFQPFRIPTSSMQPTLYGIHFRNDLPTVPGLLAGILFGGRNCNAEIRSGGQLDVSSISYQPGFFDTTSFRIGDSKYTLPGEPAKVMDYAGLDPYKYYLPGETLAKGMLVQGDHLFVERFSLYLAPPARGDVMVFTTDGIFYNGVSLAETGGSYYIKRLAALPGDTVKLENNQLYVMPKGEKVFHKIQDIAPVFAKIYSGKGGYQGHDSGMEANFPAPGSTYTIPENHYYMLGDNSRFSGDSRFFGAVPRKNLVGRAFLVFWPFSRRTGIADMPAPLDVPTGEPGINTFPVMFRQ